MVCTNCLYGSNNRMTASSTSARFLRWELCLNEEVPATFDYGQDSTFLFGSDYGSISQSPNLLPSASAGRSWIETLSGIMDFPAVLYGLA